MVKKRFKLAILLVLSLAILLFSSTLVYAGCCMGPTGCSRAFMETECPAGISTFSPAECEDEPSCDVVACCHNISGMPTAMYRASCQEISPTPGMVKIGPFITDPTFEETYAGSLCEGAVPSCSYVNCEQENSVPCQCGSSETTENKPFCCGADSSVFGTEGACRNSPSCSVGYFFDLKGQVLSPEGLPIPGATVRAGGKQAITDSSGNFTIPQLPDESSGSIVAIKNQSINSTQYTISGEDLTGVVVTLRVTEVIPEGAEDCTNGWDDDGDQFGWNSTLLEAEGYKMAADWCDSDCPAKPGDNPLVHVDKSVSRTYYRYENEWASQSEDFCSDNIDNDCDGFTDCEDEECKLNSPACQPTFCGDGVVQFPNSMGEFEQCDVNASGEGDDSLCPGKCIPPGEPNQCHCLYEAVCGNGIIDEPLEDCDGSFIASENRWDPAQYNSGSDCTIDMCGTPNSARPCQCPPPQVCGNGIIEEPEECDLGNPAEGIDPAPDNCEGCSPDCRCPPEPVVCGNNLIEFGEDCDGNYDPFANGGEGAWTEFKLRKYGCTRSTCAPPEETWLEVPGRTSDDYQQLLEDIEANGPCTCPTDCRMGPPGPNLTSVSHVRYEREFELDWTDECTDNVKTYNVLRCEADDAEGTGCEGGLGTWAAVNTVNLGVTDTYSDSTFSGSKENLPRYYCYKIEGIYETLKINSRKEESNMICVEAGREECFSFRSYYPDADEFCVSNVRSMCDENNSITEVDDTEKVDCNEAEEIRGIWTEYVCVGPYSEGANEGRTECVPKSVCDYCSDPFGVFSYSRGPGNPEARMELPGQIGDPFDYGRAPEQEGQPRDTWVECFALDFCYMDYTKTTSDMFYARPDDPSCYDYRSEEACLTDKLQIGNCEWAPHPDYQELGIGVCRSKIVEEQECLRCHDPINKVFGKCDREMCSLYGRCYYDKENLYGEHYNFSQVAYISADNPVKKADLGGTAGSNKYYYQCRPERDISCANFDTREDCINSASPYSLGGAEQLNFSVDVDVSGNMSGSVFKKLSGTNELIQGSDDFFNFSKCAWEPEYSYHYVEIDPNNSSNITETFTERNFRCIKNSDDNPPESEKDMGVYYNRTDYYQQDDCENIDKSILLDDTLYCRKDIIPPSTNLPLYEDARIAGSFDLTATVSDDSLDYTSYAHYPTTYACIAEEDMTCYPSGEADTFGREFGNAVTYDNVNINVSYNISEDEDGNFTSDISEGIRSGWYIFRYFSEDISHNLEPVKQNRVYIDSDPPNVVLSFSNSSWEMSPDIWRTNLSLTLDIVPRYPLDDDDATCNAKLFLENYSIFPLQDIVDEYNNSWEMFYDQLHDDYYTFWYRCEDDVGNVAEEEIKFVIDGDRSIIKPRPKGTVSENELTLQVQTGTNAECRYLESTEEIPAFDTEGEFDPAVFDTMNRFGFTGSPENPTTVHRSDVVLPHGYHRFYVKCLMFADEKIRGNNADQIRFAVDNDAPSTDWSTNIPAYNNWYNDDVNVELSCDDPVIYGQGTQWQFGCDLTYFCVGTGCAEQDEWILYTSDIKLDKTTNVSFYSLDKGGNQESVNRDVLFQIDKEPAEVSIDILEGDSEAGVIVLDNVYKIRVSSDKPIISPLVESPILTYSSEPSKFSDSVELYPTDNTSVWEGIFRLDNINANRGFEGVLNFEVSGHDYHNVGFFSSRSIAIDTKPPTPPVIEPSLVNPSPDVSEFQMMPYPVNWRDGVYYTNEQVLKITGYTDEHLDIIGVTTVDGIDKEHPFTQASTNMTFEDQVVSGFQGSPEIRIAGDITNKISADSFVGFGEEQTTIGPRKSFGHYGLFYDITSLEYIGGDEQYTKVRVYPPLEGSLAQDDAIAFYDKEKPSYWFGLNLLFRPFRNNTFYLKAYDAAENLVRVPAITDFPSVYTFFYDPNSPKVLAHSPIDGSTSRDTFDFELFVTEGKLESGIDFNNTEFLINGENVPFSIEVLPKTDTDPTNIYYRIYHSASDLDDGTYDIEVITHDLAGNSPDEATASASWTVVVDQTLPADPVVSFDGCLEGIGEDRRWYCAQPASGFTVDFSGEPSTNQVVISDIAMASSPTAGEAANCTETNTSNVFHCMFDEPKGTQPPFFWADYGVIIKAYKILSDNTESNVGSFGPFPFTVDDVAPDFTQQFNTRLRDNFNLSISTIVNNEIHPLTAEIEIFDQTITTSSSGSGNEYSFTIPIPDYDKSQEGPTDMSLTLIDSAGNERSVTIPVYIDLTPPSVADLDIMISNSIEIAGESFTSNPNVTVSGTLNDDDVVQVFSIPGDYNESKKDYEDKKLGTVLYSEGEAGPACDESSPEISLNRLTTGSEASLDCKDDNSGCSMTDSFYGTSPVQECAPNMDYVSTAIIPITDPLFVCYNISDEDGNRVVGTRFANLTSVSTINEEDIINTDNPLCKPIDEYTFSVTVRLYDPLAGGIKEPFRYHNYLINQINNMTLVFTDAAGHQSSRRLKVIHDIAAPLAPEFEITEGSP